MSTDLLNFDGSQSIGPREMSLQEILIAYGSQTGNAEYIAKHIYTESQERGYKSRILTLNDTIDVDWTEEFLFVIVTSSTGDGDPPDNALTFFKKRNISKICGKKYAILGLGDSNYDNFNNTAKKLDKILKEFGSESIIDKGLADDATGLEVVVEDWLKKLWEIMPNHVARDLQKEEEYLQKNSGILKGIKELELKDVKGILGIDLKEIEEIKELTNLAKLLNTTLEIQEMEEEGKQVKSVFEICGYSKHEDSNLYTQSKPFQGKIIGGRVMTGKEAVKKVLELEIDIRGLEWDYEAGDVIGIVCPNPDDIVHVLLERLKLKPNLLFTMKKNESFNFPVPCTVFNVFKYYLEIHTVASKQIFRLLAEYTSDLTEKKFLLYLSSKQGMKTYKMILEKKPTLLDILLTFPNCFPPLQVLLEHLHHLQPRWYSVANSPLSNPDSVKILFNIVEYQVNSRTIKGLCTPWLEYLIEERKHAAEIEIPVFPKPKSTFKLENPTGSNPLIFIAAGTGIAPIIGFLQHLSLLKANVKVLFIYGHRYNFLEKNDFLYSETLNQMVKDNVCKLIECTSQESNTMGYSYVQDAIRGESSDIFNLVERENATIYVCGSPAMSKNVNSALSDVWSKHSDLDQIKILEYLKSLTDNHRIKRDLW